MMRSPSTTTDAIRWEQRAEFSSRHPVPEPRTSAGSFLRIGPATVRAAEGAMGRGKHFKIRPPNKDDAFPMFFSMILRPLRSPLFPYSALFRFRIDGNRGPNFLRATRAGAP